MAIFFRAVALGAVILQFSQIGLVISDGTGSCYKCSKDDDRTCNESKEVDCDFTTQECIVYQYQDQDENSTVTTTKNCVPKNSCLEMTKKYRTSLIMCNECTDANCNKEINTKFCIHCDSAADGEWCNQNIIDPDAATCSLDDTVNPECIAYRYIKEGNIHTYRGCASTNFCNNSNSSKIVSCSSCSDDKCNKNIILPSDKNVCLKCNSLNNGECANDDMDLKKFEEYCFLEDSTECVAQKYLDVNSGKMATSRSCESKDYCSNSSNETITTLCNQCSDGNICNKKMDTTDENTLCVECDGDSCGTVDLTTVHFCQISNPANEECIAYHYFKEGKMNTYRGCSTSNSCSALEASQSNITACKDCQDNICNKDDLGDDKTLCIQCSSENDPECAKDDMRTIDIGKYCSLRNDSVECAAYKYLDINSGMVVTSRSCESKDFCSKESKLTTVCNQCSKTICNGKIDLKNETTLCVQCTDQEGSECAADNVDLTKVDFCSINVNQSECVAFKYFNEGKTMTHRGCADKDYCAALESEHTNTITCNSCSDGNNCNRNLSLTDEKTLCIQCSSADDGYCSADDISWSRVKNYCALDSESECVAYKYFDVSTSDIVTYRGCASKNHCNTTLSSENGNVTVCNECSENVCNKRIDQREESTLCAVCTGEEGSNCARSDSIDLSHNVTFCRLTDNDECVADKYISGNQLITHRGCAQKDLCANKTSNSTVCKSCTGYNNCNLDLSLSDESTLCIECTSEDDPECAKDDMNSKKVKEYCHLNDSTNCVAYKFVNGQTGNISTYRGCVSKGYCEDAALSKNKTVCNECSGNICNKKVDTSKQETLCVQCRGLEGSSCDTTSVDLTKTAYCSLNAIEKECVAYTTLEGHDIVTVRGCEAPGFCENDGNASERKACESCNNATVCNANLDLENGNVLCVQCSSEKDKDCASDQMNQTKIKNHCKLDSDKKECILYKYHDQTKDKTVIVRDCVTREETSACTNLPISDNTTLQNCYECTSDICNLNVIPLTTSTVSPTQSPGGAPSMNSFCTVFMILLISVLILV